MSCVSSAWQSPVQDKFAIGTLHLRHQVGAAGFNTPVFGIDDLG